MSEPDQPDPGEQPTVFRLTIRSLPSGYAPLARLRRALSHLRQVFQFQAVAVEQVHPPGAVPEESTGASGAPVSDDVSTPSREAIP